MSNMDKKLLSTSDVARLLGISRIAVFKKIKSGEIRARRVGRSFVVAKSDLPEVLGDVLGNSRKSLIEKAVRKTVKEYGQTLKLLGRE